MKRLLYILGILVIILNFIQCETETEKSGNSGLLTHFKTNPGGCNEQATDINKNVTTDFQDTTIFTINNDTLDIYVGLNYICCAPFITQTSVINDSIIITISDTCAFAYHSCYCRCYCYYTWNFLFSGYTNQEYACKIIVNDPREDAPLVFWEGLIN